MLKLALPLVLLASPAAAASLTCEVLQLCETGGACEDGAGMKVRLDLDEGGQGGAIVFEPGGEYERAVAMKRIAQSPEAQSYVAAANATNVFFLTLYTDGALMMSAHEQRDGSGGASAAKGTCPKGNP